jgi:hypothetical protein
MRGRIRFVSIAALAACATLSAASHAADSFYAGPQLFSKAPNPAASLNRISRFGAVGIGLELHQPAFVMKVALVEPGSPAAATGKIAKGQVIESINGQTLAKIDPRIQLGDILTEAEATDGKVRLMVRDDAPGAKAEEVVVEIPVLGRYAKTWPLDCPKSEKIVRNFADYLAKPGTDKGFADIGMLFLLATGEEKDLEPVRQWVHGLADKPAAQYPWGLGYGGIPLCEYYLRTGDATAIPVIEKWVARAAETEYLDAWLGRGGVSPQYGFGHLNAAGTACVTFLCLAKECGAKVSDDLLLRTLVHFFRYSGRGNNPYGDDRPERSFVDNGKNGNLAFAMAAAASLTPEGEKSIYARARDINAMSSVYTTTFMLHGHTGGGIGEIWRSGAMGLLHDRAPKQYRDFMDCRRWHYELSRRHDGSFGIVGGSDSGQQSDYDLESWGAGYALTYVIPRKTLRLTGRASKFAKPYQLPARPWGTEADDVFQSLEPVADTDGTRQDVSGETIAKDSILPLLGRLTRPGTLPDAEMQKLVRHPSPLIRQITANNALGIEFDYMWEKPGDDPVRLGLIHGWLRDPDPRLRRAAVDALARLTPADKVAEYIPPDVFATAIGMLKDPAESWWVKDAALFLVARGTPDMIVPHVDAILPYLSHQEHWFQNAALVALTPVVADERCAAKVLPAIGQLLRTCERWSTTGGPNAAIRERLKSASPAVQKLAAETLKEAYTGYAGVKTWSGGQNVTACYDAHLELLAGTLADVPGGYDILYKVAKERFPNESLPYAPLFLAADPAKLGPELKKLVNGLIRQNLIPEYVEKHRQRLLDEAAPKKPIPFFRKADAMAGLVDLYDKTDVRDYDWHAFGPNLEDATWDYFTFDPPEQQKFDVSPWRYRPVTLPPGMEEWFAPGFDPAKAGWKKGQTPIGQYEGQLVTDDKARGYRGRFAVTKPMRTLWEKEALLVRGTFQFPPPKPGHRYRIVLATGTYPGAGDGYRIYVNGKLLAESKTGVGKWEGGTERGGLLTQEFLDEFAKGPVTIAATTFLRYGDRAVVQMPPVPQGVFGIVVEEMKIPPLDAAAQTAAR